MKLSCQNISCHREAWNLQGATCVKEVSVAFAGGSLCGVAGQDGSGKNLLLNLLGLLERPDSGAVFVDGVDTSPVAADALTALRNEAFGFLFSETALLPAFSVAENVAMPLFRICGMNPQEARERTMEVLEYCDIADEGDCVAGDLEMTTLWRTAFARALVHRPRILIAISPRQEDDLLPLARRVAEESGVCILWGGESASLGRHAHRLIRMQDGNLSEDLSL
ncbi:MAG: ATP-binding cassette domain-containing protein [Terrimicrobiaceae bacterium]